MYASFDPKEFIEDRKFPQPKTADDQNGYKKNFDHPLEKDVLAKGRIDVTQKDDSNEKVHPPQNGTNFIRGWGHIHFRNYSASSLSDQQLS